MRLRSSGIGAVVCLAVLLVGCGIEQAPEVAVEPSEHPADDVDVPAPDEECGDDQSCAEVFSFDGELYGHSCAPVREDMVGRELGQVDRYGVMVPVHEILSSPSGDLVAFGVEGGCSENEDEQRSPWSLGMRESMASTFDQDVFDREWCPAAYPDRYEIDGCSPAEIAGESDATEQP